LSGTLLQLCIALSTGFIEEIVFRRYILEEGIVFFNDRIFANMFATVLFVCIHLPIIIFVYHYSLIETTSYLCLLTLTGIVYGFVYLHKKSLIASSVTHAVWNFLGTMIR
jgi:membrane protease YdiL (CAAX protease family)